jgi:lactate dehydrogenase-like 2-hydroxyacid dehydrogenase
MKIRYPNPSLGVTMLMILFVWGSIAYLFQKKEETMELSNMRKEVLREKQYREVGWGRVGRRCESRCSPLTRPVYVWFIDTNAIYYGSSILTPSTMVHRY